MNTNPHKSYRQLKKNAKTSGGIGFFATFAAIFGKYECF